MRIQSQHPVILLKFPALKKCGFHVKAVLLMTSFGFCHMFLSNNIKLLSQRRQITFSNWRDSSSLSKSDPSLPTMQLYCQQCNNRIGCLMLVAANVALHIVSFIFLQPHLQISIHFQTCILQPQLTRTQVVSVEDIYQTSSGSHWRHKRLFTDFFYTGLALQTPGEMH